MAVTLFARQIPNNLISKDSSDARKCKYTGHSVRSIPIRVITVGKKRPRGVQLIVDEYKDKLQHYCSFDDVLIRSNPKNARDVKAQIEDEDSDLINLIKSNDRVVILDERGRDLGSEQFAELIGDAGLTGASRIVFCIGGPYGHGRQIRERANSAVKLSSLVLNHQIALLVLMEQLYRLHNGVSLNEHGLFSKVRSIITKYLSRYLDCCIRKAVTIGVGLYPTNFYHFWMCRKFGYKG